MNCKWKLTVRTVRLYENIVVKRDAPHLMRVEVEKTRLGYELGQATGLFRVPRILDYDADTGTVTFERVHDLRTMRDALATAPNRDVVSRVGHVLAAIHDNLALPDEIRKPLPVALQEPHDTEVFIHGDFTVENLLISERSGTIVVLDWQMTSAHGCEATWGTRFFDISCFIGTLFFRPLEKFLGAKKEFPWAELFLKSYSAAAKKRIERDSFRSYLTRYSKVNLAQRHEGMTRLRQLSMVPANLRMSHFIRSFEL